MIKVIFLSIHKVYTFGFIKQKLRFLEWRSKNPWEGLGVKGKPLAAEEINKMALSLTYHVRPLWVYQGQNCLNQISNVRLQSKHRLPIENL